MAPPPDPHRIRRLRRLADWLDSRWTIPGTGIRIGLDGIASIVPVVGDSVTGVVSAWMVLEAARLGVPRATLARMAWNVGLDWTVGSIPVAGTLFDIGWKANNRNLALILRHLEQRGVATDAD